MLLFTLIQHDFHLTLDDLHVIIILSCVVRCSLCLQVIVMWTANTERFCDVQEGLNTTAKELMTSIAMDKEEVSPSTIFAVASILEGVRSSKAALHIHN